jgi:hypothetical protein
MLCLAREQPRVQKVQVMRHLPLSHVLGKIQMVRADDYSKGFLALRPVIERESRENRIQKILESLLKGVIWGHLSRRRFKFQLAFSLPAFCRSLQRLLAYRLRKERCQKVHVMRLC